MSNLTNELAMYGDQAFIKTLISGAPKFYGYTVILPDGTESSVVKIKGIRMNFKNAQTINIDTMRDLIISHYDTDGADDNFLHISNICIGRTRFHDVVSREERKIVRPVYTKRWFIDKIHSLPYGYKTE